MRWSWQICDHEGNYLVVARMLAPDRVDGTNILYRESSMDEITTRIRLERL
jgi:hypothetical protein